MRFQVRNHPKPRAARRLMEIRRRRHLSRPGSDSRDRRGFEPQQFSRTRDHGNFFSAGRMVGDCSQTRASFPARRDTGSSGRPRYYSAGTRQRDRGVYMRSRSPSGRTGRVPPRYSDPLYLWCPVLWINLLQVPAGRPFAFAADGDTIKLAAEVLRRLWNHRFISFQNQRGPTFSLG